MKKISLLLIVMILSSCQPSSQNQDSNLETLVESAIVVRSDITRYHQVPALFMAVNRADLAFQLSGTVDRVFVKIGQSVESDQALMGVYNPNINPALDSNLAKLESLSIQKNQVEKDVSKLRELRKNNSTSQNALEQKETDYKDLQAQLKLVQSQIDLALANQSESIIKAPFNGTITSIFKQEGEFVQAGQAVITINQQDSFEVEVNITRLLWKNLELGDEIKGHYDHETYTFKVVELSQSADAKSHLMKVVLELNENLSNVIGQQVTLDFPQKYQNIYQLPLETIVDDGINQPYIFTVINDLAVRIQIQPLFIQDGLIVLNTAEDIKGSVIIKGQSKLTDGMKVKVL